MPWVGCLDTLTADTSISFQFNRTPHCRVPNAKGKTLASAKKTIRSRNCRVGKITYAASGKVQKGDVTSQMPKPGTQLRLGAKVNLVVSRGRR
jgi:serine/threonine-protein kinase